MSDRLPNARPPTEEPSRVTPDGDRVAPNRNRSSRLMLFTNTSLGRGEIHALGTDDGLKIETQGAVDINNVGARALGDKVVNKVVSNLPIIPRFSLSLSRR